MLEMSYPEPKQTLGRWKRRIRSQNKLWDAGNVVSCTKTNFGTPEMSYPAPKQTSGRRKCRILRQNKRRQTGNAVSGSKGNARPSKCRKQDSDKVRTKKLTIFVGIL